MKHVSIDIHLIDILKVEPRVEGSDGQVQVWQLEICHSCADVPLVSVDAERGEQQAVLIQIGRFHGDGEALHKNHGERIGLDLWEAEGWRGHVGL